MSSNIDKIIPGESKRTKRPKSCKDIQRKCFLNNIAIYFSVHKPSNSSEIVQNISSSINTLIIGLSFLLTFSFAFIGIGLFIVFIRSFIVKKS